MANAFLTIVIFPMIVLSNSKFQVIFFNIILECSGPLEGSEVVMIYTSFFPSPRPPGLYFWFSLLTSIPPVYPLLCAFQLTSYPE